MIIIISQGLRNLVLSLSPVLQVKRCPQLAYVLRGRRRSHLCGFPHWVKLGKLSYPQKDSRETVQSLQKFEGLSRNEREQWLSVIGINGLQLQGDRLSSTSPSEMQASSLGSLPFLFSGPLGFSILLLLQDHEALSMWILQPNPGATHRVGAWYPQLSTSYQHLKTRP